jgi:CRP-like cAMP-binding protein
VVSATVADGDSKVEAGRMGPSEVMGEQSILADTPSQATFTALTSSIIYRLDKSLTRECMEQRTEVGRALNKLQAVRQQNSRLALMGKPVAVRKGGFLGWLQKR